jgi:hypothetical protein
MHRNNTSNRESTPSLQDNVYQVGKASDAGDYIKITQFLMTHIRKTYTFGSRIANSLERRSIIHEEMPRLQVSPSKDAAVASIENREFELQYKLKMGLYFDNQAKFKQQMEKVYGFLFSQCSVTLQDHIKTMEEFELKIKENPIELLGAIERHAVNAVSTRNPYDVVVDGLTTLVQTRQRANETVYDYTQRFISAKNMYETLSGSSWEARHLVLQHPDYEETDLDGILLCENDVSERLMTMLYLKNSDENRFGSFIEELASQQSLGNDQYPRTILTAQAILDNRRCDEQYSLEHQGSNKADNYEDNSQGSNTGQQQTPELSFQQLESNCWCCGKTGHRSNNCFLKDKKPKHEWPVNKVTAIQHLLSDRDGDSTIASEFRSVARSAAPSVPSGPDLSNDFTCLHQVCLQQVDMPELSDWWLLDSASSVDLFCNKRYVTNIHSCGQTLSLASTGGMFTTNLKATVPGYGLVWFSEKAISNIFSLAGMIDRFKVIFDSEKAQAIIAQTPRKDLAFSRISNNLFVYKPTVHSAPGACEVGRAYKYKPSLDEDNKKDNKMDEDNQKDNYIICSTVADVQQY